NISVVEEYVVNSDGDYKYESGIKVVEKFMELPERPTAVFATSDSIALGIIHGAQDLGLNVPEDIEVFGFDNTKLTTMVRPTLSTVVQPTYDIGAVAMRLLTKFINKEEVEEKKVILPHRL